GEGALDGVLEVLAGGQVAQPQRVSLVAGGVDSVEEPPAVIGQRERAEGEEVLALGGDVRVEDDLFTGQLVLADLRRSPIIGPGNGHAHADSVVESGPGAGEVPVVAAPLGH